MKNVKRIVSIVLLLSLVLALLPMGTLAADNTGSEKATFQINYQPKTKTVFEDREASFGVYASGTGLKYQWYYRNSSTDTWKKWVGMTSNTLKFTAYASRSGHQYCCKLTNKYGKTLWSKTATLYVNKINYRALLIGQKYANYYSVDSRLPSCEKDAYRMKNMLGAVQGAKGRNWYVNIRIDATYSGIQSAIKTAFANSDDNDVNFFYYSGHGASDGSIVTVDGSYVDFMSTYTLANLLKGVKGKVIVLMDCCYSGKVITKGIGDGTGSPDSFNQAVIQAFSSQDEMIRDYSSEKSGEMRTSKFFVLTASSAYQTSWCNNDYGFFTYYVDLGGRGYADTDKNKKIALNELYNYVYSRASGPYYDGSSYNYQYAQVYPANSYYTLFKLK